MTKTKKQTKKQLLKQKVRQFGKDDQNKIRREKKAAGKHDKHRKSCEKLREVKSKRYRGGKRIKKLIIKMRARERERE